MNNNDYSVIIGDWQTVDLKSAAALWWSKPHLHNHSSRNIPNKTLRIKSSMLFLSHDAPHLQRVPDGQQRVLGVSPFGLAGGTKVVVRTNRTLETSSHHGTFTAVTGDVRVQSWGRGQMKGRGMVGRRGGKGEGGEGVERKVSTVLLFL